MGQKQNVELVYKEQVVNILLNLLEIASIENKGVEDFEKRFQKFLKFQKEIDWKRFRASIDLLVDTDYAIIDVFRYQLGKEKTSTLGERYLRLYGVLNAVYLQMSAYRTIAKLINYPLRANLESKFKELNIYKLRNLAAAHTLDYEFDNEIDAKTFRLMQADLDYSGSRIIIISEQGVQYDYSLMEVMIEYDELTSQLLAELVRHAINELAFKKDYKIRLMELLNQRVRNLVTYSTLNRNI